MNKKIVLLLSAILVSASACGGAEALIPSIDSYIEKEGIEIPDEPTDTQLHLWENSEKVLSMTPASDANMLTEKEAVSLLESRGFSAYPVTYDFTEEGEYVGETEIAEPTDAKHPVYHTYKILDDIPIGFDVYIKNDQILAYTSQTEPDTFVSETEYITDYADHYFFVTIPKNESVVTVESLSPESLAALGLSYNFGLQEK